VVHSFSTARIGKELPLDHLRNEFCASNSLLSVDPIAALNLLRGYGGILTTVKINKLQHILLVNHFLNRLCLASALMISTGFGIAGCGTNPKGSNPNAKPVIETLVNATESWSGDAYSYPDGRAQMTLLRITIPAGFRTPVHIHPQPGVAYVVKGRLECVVKADQTLISGPGDSFATTFGEVPHYCENIGEDEGIVYVTYAGVEGQSVTASVE